MNRISNDNKTLIISYPFPPIPYVGAHRMLRICKSLSKLEINVQVLTIKIYKDIPNDFDFLGQVPQSVTINRSSIIDPWRRYQAWRDAHSRIPGFRYINKIISMLLRFITIPDHQIFWIPFAVASGLKLIKQYSINKVLISSPPFSTQLVGYFLKKITHITWIADLRDPIVENPFATYSIKQSDMFTRLERKAAIRLEKLICSNADKIITTTETHRNQLAKTYKLNKFVAIRNCFDLDNYKNLRQLSYNKFTISHLGSMYGLRKADLLFKAIKIIENDLSPQPLKIQVLFVGINDQELQKSAFDLGVENYVEIKGLVSHKESIEIMTSSHLLLMIKATGENSYGQIPAKFFDYLGTGNKILCLGPEESEVASLIRSTNVGYVIENDAPQLATILKKHYTEFINGEWPRNFKFDLNEFSLEKMGEKFSENIL